MIIKRYRLEEKYERVKLHSFSLQSTRRTIRAYYKRQKKFPPIEKDWQNQPPSYEEAAAHALNGGNVGVLAGNKFLGFDQDDPGALRGDGLQWPMMQR